MYKTGQSGKYTFGYSPKISNFDFSSIADVISGRQTSQRPIQVLAGRGHVSKFDWEGIGSVVLKQYHRGGVLGKFNSCFYLKFGESRPAKEYNLLESMRALSVNAPEPLLWVTEGKFLYQGWLLMREIEHSYSLAEVESSQQNTLEPVMRSFAGQVEKLILAGVYHVDLHPGNVLVDSQGQLSIIDFDKAHPFKDSPNKLRDLYLCRWRRAVLKHGLPDFLSEYLCAFLRKNFSVNNKQV